MAKLFGGFSKKPKGKAASTKGAGTKPGIEPAVIPPAELTEPVVVEKDSVVLVAAEVEEQMIVSAELRQGSVSPAKVGAEERRKAVAMRRLEAAEGRRAAALARRSQAAETREQALARRRGDVESRRQARPGGNTQS